jgi:hypothetical protein
VKAPEELVLNVNKSLTYRKYDGCFYGLVKRTPLKGFIQK